MKQQQQNYKLILSEVVRLIDYKNNLDVFIFLNKDKFPKDKLGRLRNEKNRITAQLSRL